MTPEDRIFLLKANLKTLEQSVARFKRSYGICAQIGIKEDYSEEEFDSFETLTSRFARVSDIVAQKIFRSIDEVELEAGGSLLDVFNRAHRRGFFEDVSEMREIRELRNSIAHEYATCNLMEIFKDALTQTPILLKIIDSIVEYCRKYQ